MTRAVTAGSLETTPIRVIWPRSRARNPIGMRAAPTATAIRIAVATAKARLRIFSTYSRRATSPALGRSEPSGRPALMTGIPRSCGGLDRHRRDARGARVGRPSDQLDEDLLERRIGDLEAGHDRSARERRTQDRLGIGAWLDAQLADTGAGPDQANPGQGRHPGQLGITLDRQADDRSTGSPTDLAGRPAGQQPAVVDDRDRAGQRFDHLHLGGREDQGPAPGGQVEECSGLPRRPWTYGAWRWRPW